MLKMSREQIRQGLDQVPIDRLLLGQGQAKERKLTKKQKAFAENLVMGKSKAAAYREAYDSKGNPRTASRRGQELAQNGAIQAYREALETAAELERISTPARLRSLVISELTKHATNEENSTKEKLQALKLLGSVVEVGAFLERREIVTIKASGEIKQQLLESLKNVIDVQAKDKTQDDGASLLAELAAAEVQADQLEADASPGGAEICQLEDPPGATPPKADKISNPPLLSNPHIQPSPDVIDVIASTQPTKGRPIDA
jgi:phage terminase small subunit